MTLEEQLRADLLALCPTQGDVMTREGVEEVVQTLEKLGIKGTKASRSCCPVANYLKTKGYEEALVSFHYVSVKKGDAICDLPPIYPVCSFICDFDKGKYPHLQQDVDGK